jgi:hypothetical protein
MCSEAVRALIRSLVQGSGICAITRIPSAVLLLKYLILHRTSTCRHGDQRCSFVAEVVGCAARHIQGICGATMDVHSWFGHALVCIVGC